MNKKTAITLLAAVIIYLYLKNRQKKPQATYYRVKKGDTLSKIAQQYGLDWRQLAKLNKLKNPNLIKVNQTIRIK